MNNVDLKEKAKKSLEGKYGQAIIMTIIFGIIASSAQIIPSFIKNDSYMILGVTQFLSIFLNALLTSFFILGNTSFYLKLSRGEDVTWEELFSKTKLWQVCFLTTILINLFTTLWSFLLIIPGIIAMYSYSMVQYILLDNENMSAIDAINKSKEMMNGHKMELFMLHLSFLGWAILGLFTFGILYLWLGPYINTTTANFYNAIKDNY